VVFNNYIRTRIGMVEVNIQASSDEEAGRWVAGLRTVVATEKQLNDPSVRRELENDDDTCCCYPRSARSSRSKV
jgi:hypothetical protein